ncbi:MAG: RNA 2',3'-cyclic phosphodiesterase [Gammaproteobacteria bacterium]|jgi:2'-5' RNA ligase
MPPAREPTRRLFFALWPDTAVRQAIDTFSRKRIRKLARRVPEGKLHITLAFAGAVTPTVQACLEEAAGRIVAAPFELGIDRAGYWPGPRIIWIGPSQIPPALWGLVGGLRRVFESCGLEPEKRAWRPHITLARKAGRALAIDRFEPIPWSIRDFSLVESVTDPGGAGYRLLRRWALEG